MSTSHAAWDVDAVHGVHAVYSVRNVGAGQLAWPSASNNLTEAREPVLACCTA